MPRKWCKSYIRTYLNNRPDTTAGERYQAIRCRMATQAPYPACRSSRRIALVAIRHTRYRLQHTPLVLFFRVDPLNDFIDPLQCQIVLFGQLRIITPIALAVNLIIPFRSPTRDTFGEINALPAPVAHHSVSNCLTGIAGKTDTAAPAGCVVTYVDGGDKMQGIEYKPLQININGTWRTISG